MAKRIAVDTVAGSRSFNRLDMQVSQALHMAIELYDSLNYMLVLDHYCLAYNKNPRNRKENSLKSEKGIP